MEIQQEEAFKLGQQVISDDSLLFIDYNPEVSLNKLLNFKSLEPQEKISYTKHLSELIPLIGDRCYDNLKEIIQTLTHDSAEVQVEFLEQVSSIISFVEKHNNGIQMIKEVLIPAFFFMIESTESSKNEKVQN